MTAEITALALNNACTSTETGCRGAHPITAYLRFSCSVLGG